MCTITNSKNTHGEKGDDRNEYQEDDKHKDDNDKYGKYDDDNIMST